MSWLAVACILASNQGLKPMEWHSLLAKVTTLTFSGGADDDVLQNSGSSITTLRFTGDSGADILQNTGSGI
ncbi:MAG: hypothetical protein ACKO26_15495, partial [Planctomycetota bacterium]